MQTADSVTDNMQAPGPPLDPEFEERLMTGWQHVHEGNNVNGSSISPDPVAPPAVAPTYTIPPYREWEELTGLGRPARMAFISDLTARCKTTRSQFGSALTDLETITQIFLAKHSPITDEEHREYFHAFTTAIAAGRNLFSPQEAYRSAITTFGFLVTDLINVLPKKSVVRLRMRKEFDEGMAKANDKEEGVRKAMRTLVESTNKGGESHALLLYMDIARQRLQNWGAEEEHFKAWASECMAALA